MAFLTTGELTRMGFGSLGKNVLISDKASIYNPAGIHLGDAVRIDDFCILSAGPDGMYIGDFVHIACYCGLMGAGKITMEAFSGLSAKVMIYSSTDDYSGNTLTNPTIPAQYKNVYTAPVLLGRHVIVGANCIILPGTVIGDGAAVGSMSLVKGKLDSHYIYGGVPAKQLKERSQKYKELEQQYLDSLKTTAQG